MKYQQFFIYIPIYGYLFLGTIFNFYTFFQRFFNISVAHDGVCSGQPGSRWEPLGSLWRASGSGRPGSRWEPLGGAAGSLWEPLRASGCLWEPLAASGSFWEPIYMHIVRYVGIIHHISYIIHHISYIIYHISYIIHHISYIIYHRPNSISHILSFYCLSILCTPSCTAGTGLCLKRDDGDCCALVKVSVASLSVVDFMWTHTNFMFS